MSEELPDEWGLVPSDDQFHPPETDDPWWTETVWFSWSVPERNLLGYFYPAFRANLGIQFGGLLVVDDTAVVPWELPVYNWSWHEPLTSPPDLLDAHDLPEGMFLQCHEFGRVYRSMTCSCSVCGVPRRSNQNLSLKPTVSTMSVSPSQRPIECPSHAGTRSSGCLRPSM